MPWMSFEKQLWKELSMSEDQLGYYLEKVVHYLLLILAYLLSK
jgi:hypothetical protein